MEQQNEDLKEFLSTYNFSEKNIILTTKEGVVGMDMLIGLDIMMKRKGAAAAAQRKERPICCEYFEAKIFDRRSIIFR